MRLQRSARAAFPSPAHRGESSKRKGIDLNDSASRSPRKRARSELVTEMFEVPFELECDECGSRIMKGKELDASKTQLGDLHGRKICAFSIKCVDCGNEIVIENNLFDSNYNVVMGARDVNAEPIKVLSRKEIREWKERRGKEILEEMLPGLSGNRSFYDVFQVGVFAPQELVQFRKDVARRHAGKM